MLSREGPKENLGGAPRFRYGFMGPGPSLLHLCWSGQKSEFIVNYGEANQLLPPRTEGTIQYHRERTPTSVFSKHPVDVFVGDHHHVEYSPSGDHTLSRSAPIWHKWLENCPPQDASQDLDPSLGRPTLMGGNGSGGEGNPQVSGAPGVLLPSPCLSRGGPRKPRTAGPSGNY